MIKRHRGILYMVPLLLLVSYIFLKSLSFPLHDFSNSYFPAHIVAHSKDPTKVLFDIYEYNNYIWELGYDEVLADFYINSPFTAFVFYPFSLLKDAYLAKAIFNLMSIALFLFSIYLLAIRLLKNNLWLLLLLAIIFFTPIRNQILFGQTYFLIISFLIFAFLGIEKYGKHRWVGLWSFASLLKLFPLIYGIVLFFNRQWKSIIIGFVSGLVLLMLSMSITGIDLWKSYIFEILPNAIQNQSTVNFQYNAQSIDVFLKSLLIQDSYYNPSATWDNETLYKVLKWLINGIILGIAISFSFRNNKQIFALLSIWVVALFLLQSRTATYTQILWIIPTFYIMGQPIKIHKKISWILILLIMCNIPIAQLESLPLLLKFLRMFLSLTLAILFFTCLKSTKTILYIFLAMLLLLPFNLQLFSKSMEDPSTYVLDEKRYFMVFDYYKDKNTLAYLALGKDGKESITTNIPLSQFNNEGLSIVDNQIIYNGIQITHDPSLKKKPVFVNECELYYLSDRRSRRGAFTIKMINTCNLQ